MERLNAAYGLVRIGDPLEGSTLCGPLHNAQAVESFLQSVKAAQEQGGKVSPSELPLNIGRLYSAGDVHII